MGKKRTTDPPLPFEFTVAGPPVSHQSRNRTALAAWQKRVRAAAAARWADHPPLTLRLRLAVTYYHEGDAVRIDTDNMVKPVQDALIGLVYADDRQVTDTVVRKTSVDGAFVVRWESSVLLAAFSAGDEFVHVSVDHAPSHEVPLR